MKALLNDLVDFNRTKLGLGINITSANVDLGAVFADEVEQLRGAHPGRRLQLEVVGDQMRCSWAFTRRNGSSFWPK